MESYSNTDKVQYTVIGTFIPESAQMKEVVGLAVDEKSEVPPDFACNICMSLVFDPYGCNKCDQIFCKICLDNWKKHGSKECPCCKQKIQEKQLNKVLMKMLNRIVIKECPTQCGKRTNLTYQTLVEHLMKDCPKIYVKCKMQGCGVVFPRGHIKSHLFNQCTHTYKECEVCKNIIKLNETNHSCGEQLQKMVKELQNTNKFNLLQNQKLQERIKELEAQKNKSHRIYNQKNQPGSVFYKENSKIYCGRHNKQLIEMTRAEDYSHYKYGFFLCDQCRTPNPIKDPIPLTLHCKQCELDVCMNCANDPDTFD